MSTTSFKQFLKVIPIECYGYEVHIIITEDILQSRYQLNDRLESMFPDKVSPSGLFCSNTDYEGFVLLKPNADIEVIAHECFHAVCDMMRGIGTDLNEGSEECYAYPLGYLSKQVKDFIKEVKHEFKKKKNENT